MKMAKYIALIAFTLLFFRSMSQGVVKNILINDIDEYNQRDTFIIKHAFSEIYLYACPANQNIKDSCILYARKKFDNNDNSIEFVKGDDIAKNEIDYTIRYSKISDSVFESTVTYPLNSKRITDEIFTDTIIKGKSQKICLYKKDKNNNIIISSHYKISKDGDIIEIDRYDLDDKFVQIFYPLGNRKPRKQWSDTLNLYGNKMIVHT
jgi:hypothetical protein